MKTRDKNNIKQYRKIPCTFIFILHVIYIVTMRNEICHVSAVDDFRISTGTCTTTLSSAGFEDF